MSMFTQATKRNSGSTSVQAPIAQFHLDDNNKKGSTHDSNNNR
ncbi:MAG: hypothetical protein ACREOZ_04850 [Gloeomargaritales cyanobacterium]